MGESLGMNVGGLHKAGTTISGRKGDAASSAKGLRDGLDAAGAALGHGRVKNAAKTFFDNYILDNANKLPTQVEAAGNATSNVASTGRSADEDAGRSMDNASKGLQMRRPVNRGMSAE